MGVCLVGFLGQSYRRLAVVSCKGRIYDLSSTPFCLHGKIGCWTGRTDGFLVQFAGYVSSTRITSSQNYIDAVCRLKKGVWQDRRVYAMLGE